MSSFNEQDHPRGDGGRFAQKHQSEAAVILDDRADPQDEHALGRLASAVEDLHHAAILNRRTPSISAHEEEAAREDRDDYYEMMEIISTSPTFRDAADQLTARSDERWDHNTARSRRSYHRHATVLSKCDPHWMERSDRDLLTAGGLTPDEYRSRWADTGDIESAAIFNQFGIDPDDPISQKELLTTSLTDFANQISKLHADTARELEEAEEDNRSVITPDGYEDVDATIRWYRDQERQVEDLEDIQAVTNELRAEATDPRTPTSNRRNHARRLANEVSKFDRFFYQPTMSSQLKTISRFGNYASTGKPTYDDPEEPF